MDWQSIETAPKDGRSILLGRNGYPTAQGWWEDTMWTELLIWNSVHESYEPQPFGYEPTHWQPLPSPPESKET